jgi:hypothetical protein
MTLRLTEGTRARVTVELLDETGHPLQAGTAEVRAPTGEGLHEETLAFQGPALTPLPPPAIPSLDQRSPYLREKLHQVAQRTWPRTTWLFLLGLFIYAGVRFTALADYPIYFFSDEAISTMIGLDLVRDNFTYEDSLLPAYFRNDRKFSLGATVYLSILPTLLFGKSVWVVRATTVLITLLAAASVGLILKRIFHKPYWWTGPLILSLAPAWFLHSRTGFETAIAASFFAAFLYFYLLYRTHSPRFLYLALIFGGLTFYSYAPGQLVMLATGAGLLVVDFRYHWENRQVGLRGAALLVLFALPSLRFHLTHPSAVADNLRESSSYLIGDYTTLEKVQFFLKQYLTGLSPLYWYFPNRIDIPRHIMGIHGNLLWITLPFAVIGVVEAVRLIRSTPHSPAWRAILIAGLASPVGAAVSGLGVTRALFFVIPITLLTTLGLIKTLEWSAARFAQFRAAAPPSQKATRWNVFRRVSLETGVFLFLAFSNLFFLANTLLNGPFWYTDYSFNGMQYGAQQVFAEVQDILSADPNAKLILSPDWANGLPTLARFFLFDPLPVEWDSLKNYAYERQEIDPQALFILPFGEYIQLSDSGKFTMKAERSVTDPNGYPAFLFIRAAYVPHIDEILAQEAAARQHLYDGSIYFEGDAIPIRYPQLDMGEIPNAFDENDDTLIRTAEANPLVLEMYLNEVRQVSGVELIIGATLAQVTVSVAPELGAEPIVFTQEVEGFLDQPGVSVDFGPSVPAAFIRLEIKDLRQGDPGHVHLWEVRLR